MDFQIVFKVLLPEFFVLLGILVTIVTSLFDSSKKHNAGIASAFLFIATLACYQNYFLGGGQAIIFDSFINDQFSILLRALIYGTCFLIVLGASQYLKVLESPAEYYPIMLSSALGAAVLTAANDFLVFFVALETLGLGAILITAYARYNKASNEAGIKYLITSAVSTAMLLMSISFIYGLTGLTKFNAIAGKLYELQGFGVLSAPLITLISVLLCAVIAFKLAAAPFHNWAPDVYSGAPTSTTLFLSVVSKIAAFGIAIRLFSSVFVSSKILILFMIFAVLSIIVGNYVGVIQMISRGTVKRLLAYSSIAQGGYLLIALSIFKPESLSALLLYLIIYAFMNTGAFLCAIYFEQITGSVRIFDYSGMIQKRPAMVVAFAFCLISLAGLPLIPAGFIAKFFLFSSAYSAGAIYSGINFGQILAIIGLIGSIVALFYYMYLVKILVVDDVSTPVKAIPEKDETPSSMVKFATFVAVAKLAIIGFFMMDFAKELTADTITKLLF
jgi:NAD(P)H-quinone oxidoreductase subunit 2